MKSIITKIIVLCMLLGTALFAISEAMPEDIDVVKEAEAWDIKTKFYFEKPSSGWDKSKVFLMIGHGSYSRGYEMTKVSNTSNLYYCSDSSFTTSTWGGATQIGVFNDTSVWGAENSSVSHRVGYVSFGAYYKLNQNLNSACYLLKLTSTSNKDSNLGCTSLSGYDALNYSISTVASSSQGGTTSVTGYELTSETATTYKSGESINAAHTSNITLNATANKGYSFTSWKDASGNEVGTNSSLTINNINAEATYTAEFTPEVYHIEYDLDGGENSENNPLEYTIETDTFELYAPKKTGYTFTGWTDLSGNTVTTITKGLTGDLSLTANWNINSYTITFDVMGGTAIVPITQVYNSDLVLPEPEIGSNEELENHIFGGWYITYDEDNKTFADKFTYTKMPAGNYTVYAKWIRPAIITLDYNGETINDETLTIFSQPIGEQFNTIVLDPLPGKLFLGWSLASDGSSGIISQYTPSQDTKLYAQWHTVSSMINGELIIDYYYDETNVINIISVGIKIMATVEDVKDDYGLIHDLTVDGYKYEINVSNYTSSNDETTIINPIVILNASLTEEYHATLSIKNGNSYVYIDSGRSFTVSDLVNNYLSTNNDTTSDTYKVVQYLYNILQSSE